MADAILLDWLEFTVRVYCSQDVSDTLDWVKNYFCSWFGGLDGEDDVKFSSRSGFRGYKTGATFLTGLARLAFSLDRLEQGFHICLPGQALAFISTNYPNFDVVEFLDGILSYKVETVRFANSFDGEDKPGIHFSRADVALDDKSRKLSLCKVKRALVRKYKYDEPTLTSRFRVKPDETRSLGGRGQTIYLGDKTSDVRCRFYNKAAQLGVSGHHNRCEFQFRDDRAGLLIEKLVKDGLSCIPKIVLGYLDFKDTSEVQEGDRVQDLPTAFWWLTFLDVTEKVRLSVSSEVRTFEDVVVWIDKQVAPSLAMIKQGGIDVALFVNSGLDRLTSGHFDLIERFQKVGDLVKFVESLGGVVVKEPLFDDEAKQRQSRVTRAQLKRAIADESNERLAPAAGDGRTRLIQLIDGYWQVIPGQLWGAV